VPNQSLHSTGLQSDGPQSLARTTSHLLRLALYYISACGLILAITSARLLAQAPYPYYPGVGAPNVPGTTSPYPNQVVSFTQPSADNQVGNVPPAQLNVREQRPNDFQTKVVRPIPVTTGYPNSFLPSSQPWTGNQPERVAQNSAGLEIIRPGIPTVQGVQPPSVPPSGVQPPSEPAPPTQAIASPFDPTQFRLPTLGLPPGLGTPEPTPEIKREYGQFVEREITPENTIQVIVGRAKVIVLRERPRRIYIPDEAVAGFQIITDQQFAVVGKKSGRTVLNLWFPDPRNPNDPTRDRTLSYLVVVLSDPERAALDVLEERKRLEAQVKAYTQALKALEKEIKEAFPDSAVQLSLVGEQVVVRGQSKDVVEAAQILRIVAEHAPTRRRTKVESKNVNVAFIPGLGDEQAAVNAIRDLLEGNSNLVNLLRVPGEQQVMLMVTVAEVNRTAARTIGMDFSVVKGGFAFAQVTGGLLTPGAAAVGAGQALSQVGGNLPTAIDNGNVLMAIQALRTLNFARSLAEPNLTTLNGRPANFQAGGSFPIPTSVVLPGGAAQSVTYQNFGVALQFVPYITDRDRIRLQLNASVSTPSVATTEVSGAQVPSQITQRQFNTTVELREGQTLTVAGLIQNNFSGTSNRVPLWGDLPIIGRTGGLDSLSSGEQELVVLVTPMLVHPLDMCKTPPLPGNDIFEPGDVEFYLLGHLEGRRSEDYRASVRTDFARQERYIHCNDVFIIGPQGTTYGCCKSGSCPCPNPCPTSPCPATTSNNSPPVSAPEVVQPRAAQ
jgi:pilus assembly protein CpaC